MAAFWGMIFLSMADDSIFYPILWIMLIISLFVSVMALWKWKVGVRAGAEPGAAIHGGGSVVAKCLRNPAQAGISRRFHTDVRGLIESLKQQG